MGGDTYTGGWHDGRMHSFGTFTWANGDSYVGEWKNGRMHGDGTKTMANGDCYVGKWSNDKANGSKSCHKCMWFMFKYGVRWCGQAPFVNSMYNIYNMPVQL